MRPHLSYRASKKCYIKEKKKQEFILWAFISGYLIGNNIHVRNGQTKLDTRNQTRVDSHDKRPTILSHIFVYDEPALTYCTLSAGRVSSIFASATKATPATRTWPEDVFVTRRRLRLTVDARGELIGACRAAGLAAAAATDRRASAGRDDDSLCRLRRMDGSAPLCGYSQGEN